MSRRPDQVGSPVPVDGLVECAIGALFLVLAAGWAASPGIVPIGAALAVVFGPALIRRLRDVITYPRIGRVPEYAERQIVRRAEFPGVVLFVAGAAAVFVVVIALTSDLGDVDGWRRWSGFLAGLLSAGGFLAAGERSRLRRHPALAVTSVGIGIVAAALSDGSDYVSVGWYFLAMGGIVATLGLVELTIFTHRNPKLTSGR